MNRRYSDMKSLTTLEERYDYLRLQGVVGEATFGFDRYLNQKFYSSREWKHIRDQVIVRDEGCDLGVPGFEIHDRIYIHHMNPLTPEDVKLGTYNLLDPQSLISTSHRTHNAIHYGDISLLPRQYVPRRPGDTTLW